MKRYNNLVHWVGNKKSNITKMHGQQHIKTVNYSMKHAVQQNSGPWLKLQSRFT